MNRRDVEFKLAQECFQNRTKLWITFRLLEKKQSFCCAQPGPGLWGTQKLYYGLVWEMRHSNHQAIWVNIIKHIPPPRHTHTYTHCVLSMRETQLQIRWGCRSRGDGVHIHEVNSMKMCYKPIEHIMHLESSDTGKKSSNWGDSNLGSHLWSNTD